jgi:hypothetical protein
MKFLKVVGPWLLLMLLGMAALAWLFFHPLSGLEEVEYSILIVGLIVLICVSDISHKQTKLLEIIERIQKDVVEVLNQCGISRNTDSISQPLTQDELETALSENATRSSEHVDVTAQSLNEKLQKIIADLDVLRKQTAQFTPEEDAAQEFTFEPIEGWRGITVVPSRKRYRNAGAWYEYDIRPERGTVFARMLEQIYPLDTYNVFNGTVLQRDQLEEWERNWLDREVTWHEVTGWERYFILFKDPLSERNGRTSYGHERERLIGALRKVKTAAEAAGAVTTVNFDVFSSVFRSSHARSSKLVGVTRGYPPCEFVAPDGASEADKKRIESALHNLLSPRGLSRYGLSPEEFKRFDEFIRAIDLILKGTLNEFGALAFPKSESEEVAATSSSGDETEA